MKGKFNMNTKPARLTTGKFYILHNQCLAIATRESSARVMGGAEIHDLKRWEVTGPLSRAEARRRFPQYKNRI